MVLCAAEIALRVVDTPIRRQRFFPDPVAGYRLQPGECINEQGLPGTLAPPRAPGELRVLCLGDSVTSGLSRPEKERYCTLLGRQLEARAAAPITVVNAGVDGYDICDMRLLLEALWPAHRPDVVVVMLTAFDNNVQFDIPDVSDPQLRVRAKLQRSALVQALMLLSHRAEGFSNWPSETPPVLVPSMAAAVIANLHSFTQLARERGTHVLFALAPVPMPDDVYYQSNTRAILDYTQRQGNPALVIQESAAWKAIGAKGLDRGHHFTTAGNEAAARVIADALEQRGWLRNASR